MLRPPPARAAFRLVGVALSLCLPVAARAQAANPWGAAGFAAAVRAIEQLGPRLEGSEQERSALAWVSTRLEAAGARVRRIPYAESSSVHSFSSGLEAFVPGASRDELVVVVPVDHAVGAVHGRDGAAGVALGVALVSDLLASPPDVGVRVLFLGAEHGAGAEYPIGSRRFLEGFVPEAAAAVLYLDVPSAPAQLQVRGGTNGVVSPQWLVERLTASLQRSGLPFRLRGNESQVLRLGVASDPGPLGPFLEAGIAAVGLTDASGGLGAGGGAGAGSAEATAAWLSQFRGFARELVRSLGRGIPDRWDRHYLLFQVAGLGLTVPEPAYVAALAVLVAACLAYGVLSGRRGRRYAVAAVEGLWSVPVHFGLLFGYALAGTFAIEGLLAALDFPTLWQQAPLELLLLKVLVGVALFALITPAVTRFPFPRSDTFYAAGAILTMVAALVGVAVYEVSLAYYLGWALVFTLASAGARDRSAKILLFVVAPAWLLRAVTELFWLGELRFVRWVLLDRLGGNLTVAAATIPFYLMALRLRLLLPSRRVRRRRIIIVAGGLACLAAASATAAWVGYLRPYQRGEQRPISAVASVDYRTGRAELQLDCPIAIREYTVVTSAGRTDAQTGARRVTAAIDPVPDPLAVSTDGSSFLGRRNVRVTLAPGGDVALRPYRLAFTLAADADYVLYDASFPIVRDPSGREYSIVVGANPPSPLVLELTVPSGRSFELVIDAEYLGFPPELVVLAPGAVVEPRLRTRTTHRFST